MSPMPARVYAWLIGIWVLGAGTLVAAYPAERTIGAMFEADQQLEAAAHYYQRWSRAHPTDYEARWHTASLLLAIARPEAAVDELESMLEDWPNDRKVLERLVQIEDSMLRVGDVVPRLEAVVAAFPDDPELVRRLADHYRWFGDQAGLVAMLRRLGQLGDHPEARSELVDILLGQRRYDELVAMFSRDLDTAEDPVPIRRALYEAYVRSGKTDAARQELGRLLELAPTDTDVLVEYAELLVAQERAGEAARLLERRAADATGDAEAVIAELYRSLADDLEARGDVEAARAMLRGLVALRPADIQARLDLAELHGSDRQAVAIAQLEEALRHSPRSLRALVALAERLSWSGRGREAVATYERALSVSPQRFVRRRLATALYHADELERAAEHFRELADAGEPADLAMLTRILIESDRLDEAVDRARALCKIAPTSKNRRMLVEAAVSADRCRVALPHLRSLLRQAPADLWLGRMLADCEPDGETGRLE